MPQKHFRVSGIVTAEDLGPLLTQATAFLSGLQIEEIEVSAPAKAPRGPAKDRNPMEGTRTGQTILSALRTGVCKPAELVEHGVAAGYQPSTITSGLSTMVKQGLIRKNADGHYEIVETITLPEG